MKKLSLLLGLLMIPFIGKSQNSNTRFGLKAGANFSIFNTTVNSENSMRTGFHLGAYIKAPIGGKTYFRPEFYYSQQGEKTDWGGGDETTTKLNYLNIPLLIEVGNKVTFQGGIQPGILLSGREKGTLDGLDYDEDVKEDFSTVDVALVLGLGVTPSDNFNAGVRFNIGLVDIYKADDDANIPGLDFPDIKSQVFHVYFAYSF